MPVDTAEAFRAESPERFFVGRYDPDNGTIRGNPNYDIALDGQRFLMVKRDAETTENLAEPEIILVQNWFEELKRFVPTP